jgi:hypothetical protein
VDTHSTLTTADKQTNVASNAVRTCVRVDLSKYHTTTMAAGYPVSSALILFILSIASKIGAPPSVFHDPKAMCVGNVRVGLICPYRNLCPMKTTLGEVRSKVCWFVLSSQSTHRRFATVCHQRATSVGIWSRIRKAVFRSHFSYQPAEKLHSRFAL